MYLLDANVPIDANRDYYPMDRVPEFWEWLLRLSVQNQIKIPFETFEEITAGKPDILISWLKDHEEDLLLSESPSNEHIVRVIQEGYGLDPVELRDEDVSKMGRDPFLISYTLLDLDYRVVVSNEGSKPGKVGSNRHVPDVCKSLQVECITTFDLIRRLDFRTR